jgi:moderate conductance mechanosensitive channel
MAAASPGHVRSACGQDPGWVCRHVLDATGNDTLSAAAGWIVGAPLQILVIIAAALVLNRIARRAVKRTLRGLHAGAVGERIGALARFAPGAGSLMDTTESSLRAEQRIEALAGILRSVISFVIGAVATFMVMGEVGINLAPLIAGAGIVGIALGFGSQSLVKDFLAGLFILIEDQFGVGDIVDLGDATGTVEAVSLRTTRLRGIDGTVWHVPNGEIRRVGNKSQHWARAVLDLEVAYESDLDHARSVIQRAADAVADEDRAILEEPSIWGVEELGANGISLRLVVKTRPSEQWRVSRLLRERIKLALDAAGIEIPFPQQTVRHRTDGLATQS